MEDPLEEEMATHSSILAGKVPWREELVGYNPWDGKKSEMTQHARTLCIYILKVKAISLNKKTDK